MTLDLIVSVISGLAVTIPLVIKLVEYVNKATREKNWSSLLQLVMSFMEQAEEQFNVGADKKEWVLAMVKESAGSLNYDVDIDVVSSMIDSLCTMSKTLNVGE